MNFSILMLFIIFASTSDTQVLMDKNEIYCFQFTWPGLMEMDCDDDDIFDCKEKINCTVLESMKIPCIEPIIIPSNGLPPNFNNIWSGVKGKKTNRPVCILQKGHSCIKYTYSFNNAIIKAAYFCGKMIEKNETAIRDGCFSQKQGGYKTEVCACQSTGFGNGMPCNSSTKSIYSITVLVPVLLLLSLIQH